MRNIYVVANPSAGRGKARAQWEAVLAALRSSGAKVTGEFTQAPGHAVDLARSARTQGADLVVAAGGDGTMHEVVNGLMDEVATEATAPPLGLIALGSGCDYARTFEVPTDPVEAARRLIDGAPTRPVDIGEIRYQTSDGEAHRYFANIAEVGIGPEVVDRASRLPRRLGPAVYFAGFCLTLPRFKARKAHIVMDDKRYDGRLVELVVAIGQYFGGGMRVAPGADPGDGVFDVQVHFGSKPDYVKGIAKVYRGTHLPHPRIREERAALVELTSEPIALVEADGEVLGHTPATFRILAGALRLKS